ncbi:glycosyltransferase [Geopsychrobacter electrodiphilus]|uniref:glycosyltransferase n=1 Tax=Geopsychrobacter electrodiphilus TaxID=225196 RepID=UPI0003709206|nr:glycosyltransferase [Geopsychrobacter electrodiphilus]
MKNVLIVSYTFPPVGGAGVQRVSKFVKYLPCFGWRPTVLTTKNPSVPLVDDALLDEISKDIAVIRTKTLEPSYKVKNFVSSGEGGRLSFFKTIIKYLVKILLIPDVQTLWWFYTSIEIRNLLRSRKYDVVFVTGPPFSALLFTVFWCRFYKKPVIADFRDEWTFSRLNWEKTVKGKFSFLIDSIFEKYVVKNCDNFISVTRKCVENIKYRNGIYDLCKGLVIFNGYDQEDFKQDHNDEVLNEQDISVVYMGTVWKATSLKNLLYSFGSAINLNTELSERVNVSIVGRVVDEEAICFENTSEHIRTFGYLSHSDALLKAMSADVLVLTISDLPNADALLPGKTFEYMATGKHILALIPDGEAKKALLENYSNCTIISPGDTAAIENFFISLPAMVESYRIIDEGRGADFSRKALTGKLADIFDGVASHLK